MDIRDVNANCFMAQVIQLNETIIMLQLHCVVIIIFDWEYCEFSVFCLYVQIALNIVLLLLQSNN